MPTMSIVQIDTLCCRCHVRERLEDDRLCARCRWQTSKHELAVAQVQTTQIHRRTKEPTPNTRVIEKTISLRAQDGSRHDYQLKPFADGYVLEKRDGNRWTYQGWWPTIDGCERLLMAEPARPLARWTAHNRFPIPYPHTHQQEVQHIRNMQQHFYNLRRRPRWNHEYQPGSTKPSASTTSHAA